MTIKQDANYWETRWQEGRTEWDIGYAAPAICAYLDQIEDKDTRILIPGSGSGYEGQYAHQQGFTNVYLVDIAPSVKTQFLRRVPDFPADHYLLQDFFEIEDSFDVVIEQTFFCAIDPSQRERYVLKMKELLQPKGRLAGLFLGIQVNVDTPPYGGSLEEYQGLFHPYFEPIVEEWAKLSIKPRVGRELWIEYQVKPD